jgi:hypothetical protein
MKTKIALLVTLGLLIAPASRAISFDGSLYGAGLESGFGVAATFVSSSAPDWETNYGSKSDAEFALLALKSSYVIADLGDTGSIAMYNDGVVQGIQDCIDMMDSVGDPVWGTGYPGDPTATVNVVLAPARRPVRPALDLRD